tara:strand:+ start:29 stop:526 length:498 start_codon:yes stop_codon:yes gene_type:complete
MAAADLNAIRARLEIHLLAGFGVDLAAQNNDILISENGFTIVTESLSTDAVPFVFRNQAYEPTPGSSFIQCLTVFGSTSYLTLGGTTDSFNQINGNIQANVFTPLGTGPGANYELADRICALYTRNIIDEIQIGPPTGPGVVAAPQPSTFFQTAISFPFNVVEHL